MTPYIQASIILERDGAGRAGATRIALLRAVADTASLTAAAKRVGLSYKAAWDAVQVLNNLFDRPLVVAATGGSAGGASTVTAAGHAVLETYAAAEAELAAVVQRLHGGIAGGTLPDLTSLLWSLHMKTSARNALRGTVRRIVDGTVNAEVILDIAEGVEIVATITHQSVADLGLAPGGSAIALIKSSFVVLARGDARTSARNALAGTVLRREDGTVASEITLDLNAGKTLTATLTRESADALELAPGIDAVALVKASHVILAVD